MQGRTRRPDEGETGRSEEDVASRRLAERGEGFHPWLAENVDKLGSVLGMDLEVVEMEASVGEFSADLLARDLSAGREVVIEN